MKRTLRAVAVLRVLFSAVACCEELGDVRAAFRGSGW
jgi:hypothetical protein